MAYQYNLTLSIQDNLLAMFNANYVNPAKRKLVAADVTFGLPTVITPNVGNGNCNTQVIVSGVQARGMMGDATAYYNRLTLAENVPATIPKALYTVNADTHATIHASIRDKFNLVGSEITFTDPASPPTSGNSATYTATAVANSYVYVPGSQLVVTVTNKQGVNP